MSIRKFEDDFNEANVGGFTRFDAALFGAQWALKKAEDACMSPTSAARIRELSREIGEER